MRRVAVVAIRAVFVLWFGLLSVLHIVQRAYFEAVLPPWMPLPAVVNVVVSAALAGTAVLLVVPSTRRIGAWAVVAVLVVLEVAHVDQFVNDVLMRKGIDGTWERVTDAGQRTQHAVRTLLQIPAVALAVMLARWTTTRSESTGSIDRSPVPR
jgi:uncharacterized membrane protein